MLEAIARATGCTVPPLAGASRIADLLQVVTTSAQAAGLPVQVDDGALTERAALLGLPPAGSISANGACRMLRAVDGWLAINLPRADDADLLPAWIGVEGGVDPWRAIDRAVRERSCAALVEQAQLLGLAVAHVRDSYLPCWSLTRRGTSTPSRGTPPRVLDLSSLWAGPLCGAVLADAGAEVIKLESTSRPDGGRFGSPAFFARLNGHKRAMTLDLPRQLDALRDMMATVDIVIESARPRVWANWGVSLDEVFAANPHLTWISVTAYGREGPRANWVGFGDDVAAAAGLVEDRAGQPAFVGDALADPLAGLGAAASAFACLAAGGGFLVDANLYAAAAFVAAGPPPALP